MMVTVGFLICFLIVKIPKLQSLRLVLWGQLVQLVQLGRSVQLLQLVQDHP